MEKRLLINDCLSIVKRGLMLPKIDVLDYYLNVFMEHYSITERLKDKLFDALKVFEDEYLSQASMRGQFRGVDENGNKELIDNKSLDHMNINFAWIEFQKACIVHANGTSLISNFEKNINKEQKILDEKIERYYRDFTTEENVDLNMALSEEINTQYPEKQVDLRIDLVLKILPKIKESIQAIRDNHNKKESVKAIIEADFIQYSNKFKASIFRFILSYLNKNSLKGSEAYIEIVSQLTDEANTKSTQPKKTKELISFKWQTNPKEELPKLYRLMYDEFKLISEETTEQQFIDVFSGKKLGDFTPLKWNRQICAAYFIDSDFFKNKLSFEQSSEVWKTAKVSFEKSKSLKQSLNNNRGTTNNKYTPKVDELIKKFTSMYR